MITLSAIGLQFPHNTQLTGPMDQEELRQRAQQLISFGSVTEKNVEQLRKLNLAVFPVRYNDKFYQDIATVNATAYTHLAYFSDIMVGAICSRMEPLDGTAFKVYIMTIGVLAPYRRLGIGKRLLQETLAACAEQQECQEVYLHVQVGNDEAVQFYRQFGFEVGEVVKDYYQKLEVTDAVILSKKPPFTQK